MPEVPACHVEANLSEIRMRRQSRGALEQTYQLEGRESDPLRQLLQPQLLRMLGAHALFHALQHHLVVRRRIDPAAAVAVLLKKAAKRADQKLALAEDIAPLLDGAMHIQEAADQVR